MTHDFEEIIYDRNKFIAATRNLLAIVTSTMTLKIIFYYKLLNQCLLKLKQPEGILQLLQ